MKTRTWKTLVTAALLGPALVLVGCKSDGGSGSEAPAPAPTLAQPVEMIESVNGDSPALKSIGAMLIKTQAQYDALGDADIFPGGLDFTKHDLVIVALGEQPTGGYSIDITSIQRVGDELAISGNATRPGEGDAVTQAITYPYDAVIIPNTDAKTVVPYID